MKTKLLFLLWLMIFSLVFFLLRDWFALAYQSLLLLLCSVILPAGQKSVNLGYESSLRLVPYLALLFATPRVAISRRVQMALVGLAVFVCIDLVIILVWQAPPAYPLHGQAGFAHLISSLIWEMLGHWLLPFLLWIITVNRQLGILFSPVERRSEAV